MMGFFPIYASESWRAVASKKRKVGKPFGEWCKSFTYSDNIYENLLVSIVAFNVLEDQAHPLSQLIKQPAKRRNIDTVRD